MPVDAIDMHSELLLGRYRILEQRGKGGFGTVYVCWDPRLMRRVAIKSIALDGSAGQGRGRKRAGARTPEEERARAQLLEAALAETRTVSMLSHPNIVSMLDFESDDSFAYIIMEYVEGASLSELLDAREGGVLTSDEAAAVVEAVCDALLFAHENGVLHLDIKPDNILIDPTGRVKLADFGMATLSSATGYKGAKGGTVGYMPPEQMRGEGVDVRSDVFAFGCVMYEALTGVRPFSAPSMQRSIELIEQGAADPCALVDSIAETVADALLCAVEADPSQRPQSTSMLADELIAGLGRPKAGRKSLATRVAYIIDDSHPEDEQSYSDEQASTSFETGLFTDAYPNLAKNILRLMAAAGAAALTGCAAASMLASVTAGIIAGAAAGVLALFAPALGGAIALVMLVGACLVSRLWLCALLVLVSGGAWWFAASRKLPLGTAPSLLGAVVPGASTPAPALLAGIFSSPGTAALSGLVSFSSTVALCALAASAHIDGFLARNLLIATPAQSAAAWNVLVSSWSTWCVGVGWMVGAAATAALCRNGSPGRCYLGCGVGLACFTAAALIAVRMENGGSWAGLPSGVLAALTGSTILGMLLILLLGTPRALNVDGADVG